MKIAVYAPAKNEAHNVEAWVSASKDADYHVLLDTGSSDDTVRLATELGCVVAQVSILPWRFDTARNTALAHVPADVDVCLICDLDERPEPGLIEEIRAKWDPSVHTRGWLTMDTGFRWRADRLHARAGFVWNHPAHELALPFVPEGTEHSVSLTSVMVHEQTPDMPHREHYLALLEQGTTEMAHRRQDARLWIYLCREYVYREKWDQAIKTGQELLAGVHGPVWSIEQAAVSRWVARAHAAQGRHDDELHYLRDGVHRCPDQLEPRLYLATYYYQRQLWSELVRIADKVDDLPDSDHYLNEPWARWGLHDMAAIAHHYLGDRDEAIHHGTKALAIRPDDVRCMTNLDYYKEGLS